MIRSQGSERLGLGPTRAEVLEHLRELGTGVPVSALAAALGLHPNTTRFHLDALVRAGLARREVEKRSHPGRPAVLYRAEGAKSERDHQRDLARALVVHFAGSLRDRRARAEASGRAWGAELRRDLTWSDPDDHPLDLLVDCLATMGYRPSLTGEPERPVIEFGFCPYRDLVLGSPSVVCQLHFGLLQGILGPGAEWAVTGLQSKAAPDHCVALLAQRQPATAEPDVPAED